MTDDTHKKLVTQLQRHINPLTDLKGVLDGNSGLARLTEDMERQRETLSAAYAPLEELRRSGALAALTDQGGAITELRKQIAVSTERFKLPEIKLASELMEAYRADHASELVRHLKDNQDYLRQAT